MTEDHAEKRHTILIVDDTPENISLLEGILSAEYTIRTASRGSEALEVARGTLPDLILLDIMMPGISGYDVCLALKADTATCKIPVIFVTALLTPGDETYGFDVGGVDYITKPVVGAVVRSRVKAQLALKVAQNELEQWNCNLKKRLLQSVANIRIKTEALMSAEERASGLLGYALTVELLSGVFELMETPFGIRSRAISELAGDAARKMKLPAADVAKVRLAGLLHDAGTLGATRGVSEKHASEMAGNERDEFHAHPARGQELFSSLEELSDVGLMVRGHHEAYDGTGFPDGLRGDDIPLGARLLAIADSIEHAASSVSNERDEYAFMVVQRHAGTLLDPKLISYFKMITRVLYFERRATASTGEVEIPPKELITGMILSRDLASTSGTLLLQKGNRLDSSGIALIRRMIQAPDGGVWIYIGKEE